MFLIRGYRKIGKDNNKTDLEVTYEVLDRMRLI